LESVEVVLELPLTAFDGRGQVMIIQDGSYFEGCVWGVECESGELDWGDYESLFIIDGLPIGYSCGVDSYFESVRWRRL
jgi:outer membrane protein assembly factor BamB